MEILSIIPARGGSKGIPKKNIKLLAGKPLIGWTIEHSLNSKLVNRTIVSTDDEEIANISKNRGAEVVIRPKELSQDDSISEDALIHVLDYLKEKENYEPDLVVFLECTSPFRREDDIDNAIQELIDKKADSSVSVCKTYGPLWMFDKDIPKPINYSIEDKKSVFRQNLKPIMRINGSIYIMKTELLKKFRNRHVGKIVVYEMPKKYSIDIDDEFDFWLAEKIINEWLKKTD